MYNPILEKRKELIDNIQKSFEPVEDDIEKAKWQIGEIRTDSRGIAHECYEYTADGKPRLRRVRKNKGSAASTDGGKKQMTREEWVKKMRQDGVSEEEIKRFKDFEEFGDSMAEQIKKQNSKKYVGKHHIQEPKKKEPAKLSECTKGDTVALVMERYNPQLGNYVTIQKKQIETATPKSFIVDGKKFNRKSGERIDAPTSVYGSVTYSIMTEKELQKNVKDGKYKGDKISGENPFEK